MIIRVLTGSVLSFHMLAYHIPGFFASAYWARQSRWLSIALPIVCMALFLAHPVGYQAAPYAAYWLIPVGIALFNPFMMLIGKYNLPFIPSCLSRLSRVSLRGRIEGRDIPFKSIFLHSLTSTLIAHAVGSVIWIYTTPMTPAFWYALIPIVAVERLVMAIGMTTMYHAIGYFMGLCRGLLVRLEPAKASLK